MSWQSKKFRWFIGWMILILGLTAVHHLRYDQFLAAKPAAALGTVLVSVVEVQGV